LLKRKEMKNVPWSFDDPNLSVLGGCGCIICNGCVVEMEKYSEGKDDRCTGCPYCGHQAVFPKDLRMWCISKQVEGHYTTEVKKSKMKNKIQDMKKVMNRLGVPVRTMHLSEDGEMSYTMDTEDKC
jgi:hypothetical protein